MTTNDLGPPPVLDWLPIDRLYVDHAYQRTLEAPASKQLITRIADGFDWRRFGTLMAAPGEADDLGPRWLVIDGQHRTEGARQRGDIPRLPATLFPELSLAEQAVVFVGANKDRVKMQAQALYYARLVAGDAEALTVKAACDAAGIRIIRYNMAVAQLRAGDTAAVPMLLSINKTMGGDILREAVLAVAECWRDRAGTLSGHLFLGAAYYLKEGGSRPALEAAMRQVGIAEIARICRHLARYTGGRAVAEALKKAMPSDHAVPAAVPVPAAPYQAPRALPAAPTYRAAPTPPATPIRAVSPAPAAPRPAPARAPLPAREITEKEIAAFVASNGVTRVPSVGTKELLELSENHPLVFDWKTRKATRRPVENL